MGHAGEKHQDCQQNQPTIDAASLDFLAVCEIDPATFLRAFQCRGWRWSSRWFSAMHGLSPNILVHEEVDSELEVGAVELRGQWWELAFGGDGVPAGAVDGYIVC